MGRSRGMMKDLSSEWSVGMRHASRLAIYDLVVYCVVYNIIKKKFSFMCILFDTISRPVFNIAGPAVGYGQRHGSNACKNLSKVSGVKLSKHAPYLVQFCCWLVGRNTATLLNPFNDLLEFESVLLHLKNII